MYCYLIFFNEIYNYCPAFIFPTTGTTDSTEKKLLHVKRAREKKNKKTESSPGRDHRNSPYFCLFTTRIMPNSTWTVALGFSCTNHLNFPSPIK